MPQVEWHSFLQHPNAQRLERVIINQQPDLCDAISVSLLSQLPLLNALNVYVPATAPASHLAPLVHCPSLADLQVCGPMDDSATIPALLQPLRQCTRLHTLVLTCLTLRVGQLGEMFMQMAQAGGRLQVLA
jgi:hypothetical protein